MHGADPVLVPIASEVVHFGDCKVIMGLSVIFLLPSADHASVRKKSYRVANPVIVSPR